MSEDWGFQEKCVSEIRDPLIRIKTLFSAQIRFCLSRLISHFVQFSDSRNSVSAS